MIWRFDPWAEIHNIFRDIDNLFRRTLAEFSAGSALDMPSRRLLPANVSFVPAVDVYTHDGKLMVRCELPGVDPNTINVEVIGNQLRISGEKTFGREVREENFYLREAGTGQFYRVLTLPEGVRTDDIRATYQNGILEIEIPAESALAPRRVKVDVAEGATKQVKAA